MNCQEINSELLNLLKQCEEIGVVIDYVIVHSTDSNISIAEHRNFALVGMQEIASKMERYANEHATERLPSQAFFHIEMYTEELKGKKITFQEFWGNENVSAQSIENGLCVHSLPNVDGYRTVFFYPPHGLRGSSDRCNELFTQVNHLLLSPMNDDNLEIYRWDDGWSNYFNEGKEWWGTFYWTIYNKAKSLFLIIGASATD